MGGRPSQVALPSAHLLLETAFSSQAGPSLPKVSLAHMIRVGSIDPGNARAEKSLNGKVRKRPISSAKIKRGLHMEMKGPKEAEKVPRTGSCADFCALFAFGHFSSPF